METESKPKSKQKKIFLILLTILGITGISTGIFFGLKLKQRNWKLLSPLGKTEDKKEKPLEKYTFENLRKRGGIGSEITLEETIDQTSDFTSYLFSYTSNDLKITGLANIPQGEGPFPVILMLRGWVDISMYQTGVGTQRAGEVLAQNGYITLAPDYLGYGQSDMPPNNIWEERFIRPMTILDLLESIKTISQADIERIGIWGHSNGGLTSLTTLALTGKPYPTTLWAPVTQFFPYDILYYIFESDDRGKALRKNLADLEAEYDTEKYSFDNYLNWINAPIQLHQGTNDPYIPTIWSENTINKLKETGNEATIYLYPGSGHQMEGSWDTVVQRDINFFNEKLTD